MKKKYLLFLPISLIIIYYFFVKNEVMIELKIDDSVNNITPQTPCDKAPQLPSVKSGANKANERAILIAENTPNVSLEDVIEMLEWQSSRGYPNLDDSGNPIRTDYDTYDNETLRMLADNNDVTAMQKYAQRLFKIAEFSLSEEYFWKATVNGYTHTIMELANIYIAKNNNETSDYAKRQNAIVAYSYMNLALKRGDLLAKFSMSMYGFEFNDLEQAKVEQLSKAHYERLILERLSKSLPDIDNSSPRALQYVLKKQFGIDF